MDSTYDLIRRGADIDPDAPALSWFGTVDAHRTPQTWTYRELVARITQTANFFNHLGATKETVIAVLLPNVPEAHLVIWGGEAAGIVFPLNPALEASAVASLLEASGAEILVTDLQQKLEPVLARVPSLKHIVALGDLSVAIREQPSDALLSGRVFSSSDFSSWFCTGGTTGLPKLAMRTHGNEVANASSVAGVMGDGIGPRKVVFCGLPLFHVNAVLVTGLVPFSRGAHVLLGAPDGYRTPGLVGRFWEIVAHHRVSFFSGVPTLYASLLQVPVEGHDLSSLEYGLCGAAPMPTEVLRAFEQRTGITIVEGYGLTEATCVSSVNPPGGERRIGSIGLPVAGQQMKTVVLDERGAYVRDCRTDEVGVVVLSGPNVFAGYRDPAQNVRLWVHCGDGRRWLDTGDLGRRDADGYFWLTGRAKDLIIRGGHNVDPAAIEEPLHRHPAVHVAAAVGRPDAHAGELPIAYVQLRAGASATEEELLAFLRREIPERAALPKHVRIVDAMPLTAVGKIFKPALRRGEAKDALEAALREAGVTFHALEIVGHGSHATSARVSLDAGAAQRAREVLGRFPMPFTVAPRDG